MEEGSPSPNVHQKRGANSEALKTALNIDDTLKQIQKGHNTTQTHTLEHITSPSQIETVSSNIDQKKLQKKISELGELIREKKTALDNNIEAQPNEFPWETAEKKKDIHVDEVSQDKHTEEINGNDSAVVPTEEQHEEFNETERYIREIVKIANERFFLTGKATTIGEKDSDDIPGYVSLAAIDGADGKTQIVVAALTNLTSDNGNLGTSPEGREIHINYRKYIGKVKVGEEKVKTGKKRWVIWNETKRKEIYKDIYESGAIILPSEGEGVHFVSTPTSVKSTMRDVDVKQWENGHTIRGSSSAGIFRGSERLTPEVQDYKNLLETVIDGELNTDLTEKTSTKLISTNRSRTLRVMPQKEAQQRVQERKREIADAEAAARDGAKEANKAFLENSKEETNENSFAIGANRLSELVDRLQGTDGLVVHYIADELQHAQDDLNNIRKLLESEEPGIQQAIQKLRGNHQLSQITAQELFNFADYIMHTPEFARFRESIGLDLSLLSSGLSLDSMPNPNASQDSNDNSKDIKASQEAKIQILETLGFLEKDETLTNRMNRIPGAPEEAGRIASFRVDQVTGESIYWNPYRYKTNRSGNIRITSPLFGPHVTVPITMDMHIVNNGNGPRLEPVDGSIHKMSIWIEGTVRGDADESAKQLGEAMLRLSTSTKKLLI